MLPLPSPKVQREVKTWAKVLFIVILLSFVVFSTGLGVTLGPLVTVLGIFLNVRAILQYIFANLNNHRMRKATGRDMVDAILLSDRKHRLTTVDINYLNSLVGKKMTLDQFTGAIEKRLHISQDRRERFWREVASYSVAVLQRAGFREVIDIILHRMGGTFVQEDVEYLESLITKRLTMHEFHELIEEYLKIPIEDSHDYWKKVIKHSKLFRKYAGFNVEMVADANVPIYQVVIPELQEVLEKIKAQLLPFRKIWLVLNDPENQLVRDWLHQWVAEQQAEVWADFHASEGEMSERYRDFLLERWQIIDLPEADKRGAMTASWLRSFGVTVEELAEFVKQMFDNPEREIALGIPECQISQNVDSDTVSSIFASWITYMTFVRFGIAGLTSNVRISNISNSFDKDLPFNKALEKWFISWSNYFKYDYANNVERAAQSWFWCVVCMSGPWMAVLTETMPIWLGRFVNYTLNNVRIKPGDDRKVTYELNWLGEMVAYHPWVVTYTDAPDNIKRYCAIQDRWTMSMYANFFTSLLEGQIWKLHPWAIIDQMYAAGFTFLVMGVFGRLGYDVLREILINGFGHVQAMVLPYIVVFVVVNLVRGFYAVWDNDWDWRGMLNAFYVILVIRYLIPIKINRLFIKGITPKTYKWAGR